VLLLASRTWNSKEDYCNYPIWLPETFILRVIFIFFLVILFFILVFSFSCVPINEDSAISCCVVSLRVPNTMHILNIFKSPELQKLLHFVGHCDGVVESMLPILVSVV
jgi:hypothetical protein